VTVKTLLTKGDDNAGDMTVEAKKSVAAPVWRNMVSNRCAKTGELLERFPPLERRWTYSLKADALSAPPWEGTNFTGETVSENGVKWPWIRTAPRSATAGSRARTSSNASRKPVRYAADLGKRRHQVLSSPTSAWTTSSPVLIDGQVTYGMDRDDPGTLKGDGEFTISEGQFSADFVINLIERQMQGETTTLPPSLKFERLYSKVNFEGDVVKTPKVELDAEGIIVRGNGQYVNDGDMDYTLNLSISPETAAQIPALRDNLNLQGYEMAQK
jgi:hypothetical protein